MTSRHPRSKATSCNGLGDHRETWHSLSEAPPWGLKAFPSFRKEIVISARTSKMEPLVRCINIFVRRHLSHLSYTSVALVHGAGIAPMNLHTHGHDDCALTGEIAIGDFDGGYLFTTGYLGGGGGCRPVHGHIGGSDSFGEAWSMQEPASSSMHIICIDQRVGVGIAMLLYATRVHRGHA